MTMDKVEEVESRIESTNQSHARVLFVVQWTVDDDPSRVDEATRRDQ